MKQVLRDSRASDSTYTSESLSFSPGADEYVDRNSLPNFKDLIANGSDASTPYGRTKWNKLGVGRTNVSAKTPAAFVTQNGYSIEIDYTARYSGQPQFTSFDESEVRNRALAKVKRVIAGQTKQAKLMAPLVECKELGRLVEQACTLVGKAVIAVADAKRRKSGKPVRKFISDTWLSLNFGLLPMIDDIDAAGKAIQAYLDRKDAVFRFQGSASQDCQSGFTPYPLLSAPFGYTWSSYGMAHRLVQFRYTGAFSMKLYASNDYSLIEHLGLDIRKVPAAAWELMGFSWLLDYFLNVGEFLEDTFYLPPGDTIYLVENRRCVDSAVIHHVPKLIKDWQGNNPNGLLELSNISGRPALSEFVQFSRSPLSKLPHASFVFKSNQTKGKYAVSKLSNLVAILAK